LLARVGKAAGWVVRLTSAIWFFVLAADITVLAYIRNRVVAGKFGSASPSLE
jgi:hypothetical protein